jgi:type II secretory pathway pseudopilin PulG
MQEWIVPVVLGVVAVLVLALVVAVARTRSRTRRELLAARAEAASLRAQLDEIERRMSAHSDHTDYVITRLGDDEPQPGPVQPPARIDGSLFADLLLRETVVKSAALAHGLRRALAPEVRNRIRFEMKREVQRARKQRRSDLKEALRDLRARERADLAADAGERHDEGDAA